MKIENKELFGKRIRECRQEKGFSQRHVADALHIGVNAVGQWERGNRSIQQPEMLKALAENLGTTPAYLLGNTDDKESPQTGSSEETIVKGKDTEKENYWGSISEAYNSLKADSRLIIENMIRKLLIADRAED